MQKETRQTRVTGGGCGVGTQVCPYWRSRRRRNIISTPYPMCISLPNRLIAKTVAPKIGWLAANLLPYSPVPKAGILDIRPRNAEHGLPLITLRVVLICTLYSACCIVWTECVLYKVVIARPCRQRDLRRFCTALVRLGRDGGSNNLKLTTVRASQTVWAHGVIETDLTGRSQSDPRVVAVLRPWLPSCHGDMLLG